MAQDIFDDTTLEVLLVSAKKLRVQMTKTKPQLGDAVLVIARLGGYLNRKSDPPPGMEVLWRGWQRLTERLIFLEEMTYG